MLQVFIGVLVSIGLFFLAYRKTIGAKKERIRAANNDIEKTLLRRIVLEAYRFIVSDVSRLIEGKAIDYRVNARDLLSAIQVLNVLFTRIMESDFITPKQRKGILEWLNPVLIAAEEIPIKESEVIKTELSRKEASYRAILPMVIFVSIIGALAPLLFGYLKTHELSEILSPTVFLVFILSIVFITLISFTLRMWESLKETSSSQALETTIAFEREVGKVLQKSDVLKHSGPIDRGYDFSVEMNGKKTIIEVKAWSKKVPITLLRRLVERLQNTLKIEKADDAIIITKGPIDFPSGALRDTNVKVMTLRELKKYLAPHMKA